MLNIRLADDLLYRKLLFTWLPLVMSLMVLFGLSFFPRIESVSEGFPTYFYPSHSVLDVIPRNETIFIYRFPLFHHIRFKLVSSYVNNF